MNWILGLLLATAPFFPVRGDVRFLDRSDPKCLAWLSEIDPENKVIGPMKFLVETPRTFIGYAGQREIGGLWEIYDKATGKFLGHIDIIKISDGVFEVPIYLKVTGEGIGSETKLAVMKYLFEKKGAREIVDYISPNNTASIKLHEKLGFVLKKDGIPQTRDGELVVPYVMTPK